MRNVTRLALRRTASLTEASNGIKALVELLMAGDPFDAIVLDLRLDVARLSCVTTGRWASSRRQTEATA
ncbi:MAG TPA: hypothetical protein VFD73_22450 [Gemmatimonadales bacterium]|nr:hypothetical protein [Gemmatimonadales bacterium]